ncbi:DNA ligase [Striga asiatica]|uniref:DNA ligase n=1 Tax=Striga asiatica TaxID=4170 RepID=A0A5A7REV0_STRAF|nr:DNA ligase [Striga asiatica]
MSSAKAFKELKKSISIAQILKSQINSSRRIHSPPIRQIYCPSSCPSQILRPSKSRSAVLQVAASEFAEEEGSIADECGVSVPLTAEIRDENNTLSIQDENNSRIRGSCGGGDATTVERRAPQIGE